MNSSMMNSLCKILTLLALIATCGVAAEAQDCATVALVGSAVQNTFVQAPVSIVNCRDSASQGFIDASVNSASSNSAVARAVALDTSVIASDGTTIVKISAQPVTVCTSVTLTFTFRFKVRGIDGTVGPERVTKVTKPFIVCPFRLDAQVVAVAVLPAEAGQESQVTLTLVNQGAQTPLPGGGGSYKVNLTTAEETSALVRNSCSSPTSSAALVSFPQLRPGEQKTLTLRFKFPQAGAFTLKAEVSLFESEDGPIDNNSRTQAVTVPLPRPLVCEVAPLTARPGDPVKFSGNWFRTFGTTETPTVRFGSVEAEVINVASPLNLTVRMPDLTCTATGQVIVTVTNPMGPTAFRGSTFPGALSITSTSRIASPSGAEEDLTIVLVNFRPNCRFTVTLEPGPLTPGGALTPQLLSATADRIVVRIRRPNSVAAYTLKVETPYGIATKPISLGGQLGSAVNVLDLFLRRLAS